MQVGIFNEPTTSKVYSLILHTNSTSDRRADRQTGSDAPDPAMH